MTDLEQKIKDFQNQVLDSTDRGQLADEFRASLPPFTIDLPGGTPTLESYLLGFQQRHRPHWRPLDLSAESLSVVLPTAPGTAAPRSLLGFLLSPLTRAAKLLLFLEPWRVHRPLLHELDLVCARGEMLLVLGGAGSGASLLLAQLSGRGGALRRSGGAVRYGGAPLRARHAQRDVALVRADDVHTPLLTVAESVDYAIALSMPAGVPDAERATRRQVILETLRLAHRADSVVGSEELRGISGGERRRLSVALEMCRVPGAYLLDEPSTGLDASMTFRLCHAFRGVAASGPPVVMSLKQAPFEVAALFDHVLVLSPRGGLAFYGTIREGLRFFADCGFECPPVLNPTDFFLEVLEHPDHFASAAAVCRWRDEDFEAAFRATDVYSRLREAQVRLRERRAEEFVSAVTSVAARPWCWIPGGELLRAYFAPVAADERNAALPRAAAALLGTRAVSAQAYPLEGAYARGFGAQTAATLSRGLTVLRRDKQRIVLKVLRTLLTGFLVATLFWRLGDTQEDAMLLASLLFFCITFYSFSSMSALPAIFTERAVLYRDLDAHYSRVLPNLLSSVLVNGVLLLIELFIFNLFVYFGTGMSLKDDGWRFFFFFLVTFLVSFISDALARLVSALMPTLSLASTIDPMIDMIGFLFAGFLLPRSDIPPWFVWIHYINPVTWAYQSLMINQFDGMSLDCKSSELVPPKGDPRYWLPYALGGFGRSQICPMQEGAHLLDRYDIDRHHGELKLWYLLPLAGVYVLFLLLTFVVLALLQWRPRVRPSRRPLEEHRTWLTETVSVASAAVWAQLRRAVGRGAVAGMTDVEADMEAENKRAENKRCKYKMDKIMEKGSSDGGQKSSEDSSSSSEDTAYDGRGDVEDMAVAAVSCHCDVTRSLDARRLRALHYLHDHPPPGGFLSWSGLNYTVHVGGPVPFALPGFLARFGKRRLKLLSGLEGYLRPGMSLALVGASGAGKSTLLQAIAKRKTAGTLKGDFTFNGRKGIPGNFHRYLGFAEQSDVVELTATVGDAVRFSALTRLSPALAADRDSDGRHNWWHYVHQFGRFGVGTFGGYLPAYSTSKRLRWATEVLAALGLSDLSGHAMGSLSLEQRKRASLAVELAANPAVCFADEPSSGLDAVGAARVLEVLELIAKSGRAVCCTVHQPSPSIFASFTHLCLLAQGGKLVYFGKLHDDQAARDFGPLRRYFKRHGFEIPPLVNPADFVLTVMMDGRVSLKDCSIQHPAGAGDDGDACELQSMTSSSSAEEEEELHNDDRTISKHELLHLRDHGTAREFQRASAQFWAEAFAASPEAAELHAEVQAQQALSESAFTGYVGSKAVPGFVQLMIVLWREVMRRWRTPSLLLVRLLAQVGMGIMLGLVFFQQNDQQAGLNGRVSALFMATLFSVVMTVPVSSDVIGERALFFRERKAGSYGHLTYWVRLFAVEAVMTLLYAALMVVPLYLLVGLRGGVQWIAFFFVLSYLTTMLSVAYGQFIAFVAPNASSATEIVTTTLSLSMTFAGFFLTRSDMPVYWRWASWLSFFSYGLEGTLVAEMRGQSFECASDEFVPVPVRVAAPGNTTRTVFRDFCFFETGDQWLENKDYDDPEALWRSPLILVCYAFFFVILTNIFMRIKKQVSL